VESVATFNSTVTDWLSRFATGRRGALLREARRFASLVAPGALQVTATLHIMSGLHRGASMELTAKEYRIGSADDCDIVLRDPQVAARHCRLTREWSGITVRDLRSAVAQPLAPRKVTYDGGAIEAQYDVGGVQFTLRHPPPPQPQQQQQQQQRSYKHLTSWLFLLIVIAGIVAAVTLTTTSGAVKQIPQASSERIEFLNRVLAGQKLGSLRLGRGAHGELQVNGVVADGAHRDRLEKWLVANHLDDVHVSVVSTADLMEEARRALADDAVRVDLRDGQLLVEGRTSRTALKNRIHALAEDLRGTVAVEDRVVYVSADDRNDAPGPLPVRVQGVMIGNPSYFLTDSGVHYFVGGVLPDGAEVLSIDTDQIQFSRGGHIVAYKLQ
jgi:type III secretion system YscD/HrpQ family protein